MFININNMITLITRRHPLQESSIKALAGYLKHYNIPTRSIYLSECPVLNDSVNKQIIDLCKDSVLVGFNSMSHDVSKLRGAIDVIRKQHVIPVILGGIHATAMPRESLDFVDYVCIGEGEEPLRQLYEKLINQDHDITTPNIGYHKGGEKIINQTSFFIKSLDDTPFPDYILNNSYMWIAESGEIKKIPNEPDKRGKFFQRKSIYFYSSRGCIFSCTYCSNNIYHRLAKDANQVWHRVASPARAKKELALILSKMPFTKVITINDDDFLERPIEQIKEISGYIKEKYDLPFTINGIPSYVTEEKTKILVENGMRSIAFGVQTGCERVLREVYKRPQTSELVLRAAKIVNSFNNKGLGTGYGFILDNPYERDDEWLQSLDLLIKLPRPRNISLYSLQFFPRTQIAEHAIIDGYITSMSDDLDKDYRKNIRYTYANTMFYINSYLHPPDWLNKIFLSDKIVKSVIAWPIRLIMAYPIGLLIRMHSNVEYINRITIYRYIERGTPLYNFLRSIKRTLTAKAQ